MKKFLKTKINLILAVILVVISIVGTFSITYTIMNKSRIESIKSNNEISLKSINELYSAAVKDYYKLSWTRKYQYTQFQKVVCYTSIREKQWKY